MLFLDKRNIQPETSLLWSEAKQNVLNQHYVGSYPTQCCPSGPTQI